MRLVLAWALVCAACESSTKSGSPDLAVPVEMDASVAADLAAAAKDAATAGVDAAVDAAPPDLAPPRSLVPNVAFITPSPSPLATLAALGSGATMEDQVISGADALCAGEATKAGLGGTFIAWLSSSHHLATARMTAANPYHAMPTGWVRSDGKPFVDQLNADPHIFYPLRVTASGAAPSSSDFLVWTGTNADGTLAASTCSDWTSTAVADHAVIGRFTEGTFGWSESYGLGQKCDQAALVYCLQVDYVATVPSPSPAPSFKWAFATATPFDPSTGLAGGDAKCDADAMAAGLTAGAGNFTALLAPTGMSAASRITSMPNVPYLRPDNVIVVAKTADLFSGAPWLAPIDRAADGSDARGAAFMGANDPSAVATANCNNWTDNTAAFTENDWATDSTVPRAGGAICTTHSGVICLQK